VWYCVALVLFEASVASGPRRPAFNDAELLSGSALPLDLTAAPAIVSPDEAFALDDSMRAFIEPLRGSNDQVVRLHRLLGAMKSAGLFAMEYATTSTGTAKVAFHERQANCLSFTIMFVALARAAGLKVRFQVVDVPPVWNNDMGLMVIGNHVNASVATSSAQKLIIDFNTTDARQQYPMREVSDRYVTALFYSNLGAEALLRQEHVASFAFLRESARTYDGVAAPWVNLGVLYARQGRYDYAEAAYLRALQADSRERSALANLVSVYSAIGRTDLAEEYRERIRRYRDLNPYYHFALAQRAYFENRFDDALGELRSAIRLKRDEDDFFVLQGRIFDDIGQSDRAVASFMRARELAPRLPPPRAE
jgi:tetratricopeptide (TPR) repeat protein